MSDRSDFVASILARSGDDLRRLAFADWLDENGDEPRAAFVRHQVAAYRLPKWSPGRLAHEDAADGLLAAHRPEWLGPWAGRLRGYEFRRGFVRNVKIEADGFEEHIDALFDWEPVARVTIELGDRPTPSDDEAARLLRRPGVAKVRELLIVPGRNPVDFGRAWHRQVAAAAHLTGLRVYGMGRFDSAPLDVLTPLCAAPHLRNLRECRLLLDEDQGGDPRRWPSVLAGATFAPRLRKVKMGSLGLTLPWVPTLAAGAFPNLRELDCLDTLGEFLPRKTPHEDWGELFRAADLPNLRKLIVSTRRLADYARSPVAKRVRDLNIISEEGFARGGGHVDHRAGWRELVRHGVRPRKLNISHIIDPDILHRVARSGHLAPRSPIRLAPIHARAAFRRRPPSGRAPRAGRPPPTRSARFLPITQPRQCKELVGF